MEMTKQTIEWATGFIIRKQFVINASRFCNTQRFAYRFWMLGPFGMALRNCAWVPFLSNVLPKNFVRWNIFFLSTEQLKWSNFTRGNRFNCASGALGEEHEDVRKMWGNLPNFHYSLLRLHWIKNQMSDRLVRIFVARLSSCTKTTLAPGRPIFRRINYWYSIFEESKSHVGNVVKTKHARKLPAGRHQGLSMTKVSLESWDPGCPPKCHQITI